MLKNSFLCVLCASFLWSCSHSQMSTPTSNDSPRIPADILSDTVNDEPRPVPKFTKEEIFDFLTRTKTQAQLLQIWNNTPDVVPKHLTRPVVQVICRYTTEQHATFFILLPWGGSNPNLMSQEFQTDCRFLP